MTTAGEDRQIEKLLARIESLEQSQRQPAPFWRNTAAVGILAGVIAIVPASITAVNGYYQTEREVRLNLAKYEHERTVSYLERALSPETTEFKQAQVLRFLTKLPEGDPLHQWAAGELGEVEAMVARLEQVSSDAEKKLEELHTKKAVVVAAKEQILAEAKTEGEDPEPRLEATNSQLEDIHRKIETTTAQGLEASDRAGVPKLFEFAPDSTPTMSPRSSKPWRIRIAVAKELAEVQRLAARVSVMGATPEIYRVGPAFHLYVGHYESSQQAEAHVGDAKRYIGQGALISDIEAVCGQPKRRDGYFVCSE